MRKSMLILLLTGFSHIAFAQDVQNTTVFNTASQNTTVNSVVVGNAKDWGLTDTEWSHYLTLMQGINGKWYPQLTPAGVLGINAESPEDKKHFAEMVAKEEHDKIARELSFDSAVHQALLRLYPDEPIIQSFDLSPFNPVQANKANKSAVLQAGDHLVLFTDPQKTLDVFMLIPILKAIQKNSDIVLDVYCVGNGDDNAIRTWAKFHHIPMELVAQGRITLNHDNGQLRKTAGDASLPYLMRVRNGQSQPVSPWSLT